MVGETPGRGRVPYRPERDRPIFDGLDAPFGTPEEANYVVCSGLFDDDDETPRTTASGSTPCARATCS